MEPVVSGVPTGDAVLLSFKIPLGRRELEIELRRNVEGLFLKLSTVEDGRGVREKLLIPAVGVPRFLDLLKAIQRECSNSQPGPAPPQQDEARHAAVLCSHRMTAMNKTFYLDLARNKFGRYLKVACQTNSTRSTILLDVDGDEPVGLLGQIVDAVSAATSLPAAAAEFSAIGGPAAAATTVGADAIGPLEAIHRVVSVGSKKYYFEASSNQFGPFLRMTEVSASGRQAMTVPLVALPAFHAVIAEYTAALQQTLPPPVAAQVQSASLSAMSGGTGHLGYGLFGVFTGGGGGRVRDRPDAAGAGSATATDATGEDSLAAAPASGAVAAASATNDSHGAAAASFTGRARGRGGGRGRGRGRGRGSSR